MILTDMKPNFITLSPLEQHQAFEAYLSIRTKDMTEAVVTPRTKGKTKKKGKAIAVTSEQYTILQKLGLI